MTYIEESKEIINFNFILCGASGSGKTSFLFNMNCKSARPNHTLKSGTKKPRVHTLKIGDKIYNFVDTVGLNDTSEITDDVILDEMNTFIKTNINYVSALIIVYDGSKKLGQTARKSYKKIFAMFDDEKIEIPVKKIMFVTHVEILKSTSIKNKIQEIKNDELFSDIDEICCFNGCDVKEVDGMMAKFMKSSVTASRNKSINTLNKYDHRSLEKEILLFRNQSQNNEIKPDWLCNIL